MDQKLLEKALKASFSTEKCIVGRKEVLRSVKGSKLVVYSASLPDSEKSKILEACSTHGVPSLSYEGSSFQLGMACNKTFRISALAIRSSGSFDLTPLLREV